MAEQAKICYALSLIGEKQNGQDWINAYNRGSLVLPTYREFEERFKRDFGDPFAKENARLKWKDLKQQEKQPVGDYNRYFTEVTTLTEYDQMHDLTVGRYKESIKEEDEVEVEAAAENLDLMMETDSLKLDLSKDLRRSRWDQRTELNSKKSF